MRLLRIAPTVRWTLRIGISSRDRRRRARCAGSTCSQDLPVEVVLVRVGSAAGCSAAAQPFGLVGRREDGREIKPLGLPVVDRLAAAQPIDAADHVVELCGSRAGP